MLLGPALREVEGVLEDAVHPDPGHHGFLDDGFAVGALEDLAADAGVLAFGVFPHHVEVDVAGKPAGQRAGHPGQQFDRAQADVLVEVAAELQQAAPQRDVVGHHLGPADGAEEDGVEPVQLVEPAVGQHRPGLGVVVGAGVVELFVVQVEVERRGRGLQDAQPFGRHLLADSVAGDDRDAMRGAHVKYSCSGLAGSCGSDPRSVMGARNPG